MQCSAARPLHPYHCYGQNLTYTLLLLALRTWLPTAYLTSHSSADEVSPRGASKLAAKIVLYDQPLFIL